MKSFLLDGKAPVCKWGMIPDEVYFEGGIPDGYGLAICPNHPYVILDIDQHGVNGFDNIPKELDDEVLRKHFSYSTKNNGRHVWFKYSGNKPLMNKTSGMGIDLRTSKGYVRWYLPGDIRDHLKEIKDSSNELNIWLESLFCGINNGK